MSTVNKRELPPTQNEEEVLRRMLKTPPTPHETKPEPAPKKQPARKKPAK